MGASGAADRAAAFTVAAALLSLALAACGSGSGAGSTTTRAAPAVIYPTKWEPVYRLDENGRRILDLSRSSRRLTLQVIDATCHAHDPRFADAGLRFAGARITEDPAAVIVTTYMHPEPRPAGGCVSAGLGFSRTIELPRPLGPRALVDGGDPRVGGGGVIAVIRVPATDPRLERRAQARFGPPDLGPTP